MAASTGNNVVSVPTETWNTMKVLCLAVKNRLEELQRRRYVMGDDRIDPKTMSYLDKLNALLSQEAEKGGKVPDLEAHQLALRKDQCASLQDSLRLAHFRESSLIAKIDHQRHTIRQLQTDNKKLRERLDNSGHQEGNQVVEEDVTSSTEDDSKPNDIIIDMNMSLQTKPNEAEPAENEDE